MDSSAGLSDAGDRWTGNAYVDRAATPGMPMIALMNRLGYDVATLGNHEFDHGQAFLGRMIDSMDFEVVCANVVSDTCTFPPLPPYTVLEEGGFRIGFVGEPFKGLSNIEIDAVANYLNRIREKGKTLIVIDHSTGVEDYFSQWIQIENIDNRLIGKQFK